MTSVVLGGSRHISRLAADVRVRLDRIVEQQFRVLVGDANGADKAFQTYLADKRYGNVEVFCSGEVPRNNVGHWPCRQVTTKAKPGTFEFYSAKDKAMADGATLGFMLWDAESAGTMVNVWRLVRKQKTSLVYLQSKKTFVEVRMHEEWRRLLDLAVPDAREDIEKKVQVELLAEPPANDTNTSGEQMQFSLSAGGRSR